METTIVIAKILGIYFTVSGIFAITHKNTLTLIMKDLFAHRAVSFMVGVFLLLGGSALLLSNKASADPLSLFVTIISWAILRHISRNTFFVAGIIITLIGLYIIFFV